MAGPPPQTKGLRVMLFSPSQPNEASDKGSLMLRMPIVPCPRTARHWQFSPPLAVWPYRSARFAAGFAAG